VTAERLQHSAWLAAIIIAGVCCAAAAQEPAAAGNASPAPAHELRPLGAPRPGPQIRASEDGERSGGWVMQTVLALGGVLALAVVGGVVVRAIARGQGGLRASLGAGGRAPAGILEVIGRYPIARGSSLVLLKLDRRVLLLSQAAPGRLGTGASFTTLCEITDPEEVASLLVKARDVEGDSMAERFRGLLTRFDRSLDAEPGGRSVRAGNGTDRVELWDDGRGEIPVVDLTREPTGAGGPIANLRQRLASLRNQEGGRGP
jgi:hypothetical protein